MRRMAWLRAVSIGVCGAAVALACSANSGGDEEETGGAGGNSGAAGNGNGGAGNAAGNGGVGNASGNGGAGNAAGNGGVGNASGNGGVGGVIVDSGGGGSTNDATCAQFTTQASNAVDIVFLIDNSGSMTDEIELVRRNINGSFATIIGNSSIDYRVIMVSQKRAGGLSGSNYVCVDPPLAGANCADRPPTFYHLPCTVESNDALLIARGSYNGTVAAQFPFTACNFRWDNKVRFESTKIFVVVTDDEASYVSFLPRQGINADMFDNWATTNVQPAGIMGTKSARKYVFYGIIGKDQNDPTAACVPPGAGPDGGAVAPGLEYQKLARLTGGDTRSICESDWSSIFRSIANGIVSRVSCELNVPKPPPGQTIDSNKVNVTYKPGDGSTPQLIKQDNNGACNTASVNGWQWNVDKTKVLLCGQACQRAQADSRARVELVIGCQDTVVEPPR